VFNLETQKAETVPGVNPEDVVQKWT